MLGRKIDINLTFGENYIIWYKYSNNVKEEKSASQNNKIDFLIYYDPETSQITIGDEAKNIETSEHSQLVLDLLPWISVAYGDEEFKEFMESSELIIKEKDSQPVVELKHNKKVTQLTIKEIFIDFFNEFRLIVNKRLENESDNFLKVDLSFEYEYSGIQKRSIKKWLELSRIKVIEDDIDDLNNKMNNLEIKKKDSTNSQVIQNQYSPQSSQSSESHTEQQSTTLSPSQQQQQFLGDQMDIPLPQPPPTPPMIDNSVNNNNDDSSNLPYDNPIMVDDRNSDYIDFDGTIESALFYNFTDGDDLVFTNNDNEEDDNNQDENRNVE